MNHKKGTTMEPQGTYINPPENYPSFTEMYKEIIVRNPKSAGFIGSRQGFGFNVFACGGSWNFQSARVEG